MESAKTLLHISDVKATELKHVSHADLRNMDHLNGSQRLLESPILQV